MTHKVLININGKYVPLTVEESRDLIARAAQRRLPYAEAEDVTQELTTLVYYNPVVKWGTILNGIRAAQRKRQNYYQGAPIRNSEGKTVGRGPATLSLDALFLDLPIEHPGFDEVDLEDEYGQAIRYLAQCPDVASNGEYSAEYWVRIILEWGTDIARKMYSLMISRPVRDSEWFTLVRGWKKRILSRLRRKQRPSR